MINKKYNRKGFTLIELLVVVAIIGILTTIVLGSLSQARAKADDAAVKSNLGTIKPLAELFYYDTKNSYLPGGGVKYVLDSCPILSAFGTDSNMFTGSPKIMKAITEAVKRGGNEAYCYNSDTQFAIAVDLKSESGHSWCIDNTGASRSVASFSKEAIDDTTFSCKP
ncbi:MAG: prepilin-type N-terminal cleavage/methylation domain-containing protein [bacterium]